MSTTSPVLGLEATTTSGLTQVQLSSLLICFLMNMFGGVDVMVISYAAPAIAAQWPVRPNLLGVVFSGGLLGMALGALLLAPVADRVGRRTMMLVCAWLMGLSMVATGLAQSVTQLALGRLVSGLGIGGMLASTATLAAEYAPRKTKDFWVSFVLAGYPLGAVLSGLATAMVIPRYGWPMVFWLSGLVTLLTVPLIWFLLAESLAFLQKRQPKNALLRINRILTRMHQPPLTSLVSLPSTHLPAGAVTALWSANRKVATIWLWIALFMAFATLYFLTSWIPKLATSAGLSLRLAIYAGTLFNSGAFIGILSQGYLSDRFGLRATIRSFLLGTAVLMLVFGFFSGSAALLVLVCLIGFGIQGGFVGLYAVAARLYPTEIRSTGVGWAIGLGRLGAIIGPLIGGLLVNMNVSMTLSFGLFALPLLLGSQATRFINLPDTP